MLNQIQTWGTWIVPPLCLPIQTWSTLCRSHQRSESRKYNDDKNLWSLPEVCGCLSRRRWHGLCCWRRCNAGAQADRACCPSSRTWPQKCRRFGKPGQRKDAHPRSPLCEGQWTKNDQRLGCASEGQRDLDPVVFFVADVDESQWIGADAPGIVELPIVTSLEVIVSDVVIENS